MDATSSTLTRLNNEIMERITPGYMGRQEPIRDSVHRILRERSAR